LPLSVDEDDRQVEPARGSQSQSRSQSQSHESHSLFGSSSSSSSSDSPRLVDSDDLTATPTSQDDVFMPTLHHESRLSDKLSASMSSIKEKMASGLESAQKELKEGTQQMEEKLKAFKADHLNQSSSSSGSQSAEDSLDSPQETTDVSDGITDPTLHSHNRTGSAQQTAGSLVHPYASNMRDADQHPGLVSLVSHANEHSAVSPVNVTHVSEAQQRGLEAGSRAHDNEPKDASAVNNDKRGAAASVTGAFSSMNTKLEEGIEAIKEKVDEWRKHGSSSSNQDPSQKSGATNLSTGQRYSTATGTSTDQVIPTLIDKDNTVISEEVRRRQIQGTRSQ